MLMSGWSSSDGASSSLSSGKGDQSFAPETDSISIRFEHCLPFNLPLCKAEGNTTILVNISETNLDYNSKSITHANTHP